MRKNLSFTVLSLMLFSGHVRCQEYSYTHYDISDGLAGSTVYCITQDKDGFIWVGTETGVNRFDGTHFQSYTTKDGLPDVEILEMFGDSRGRVWMAPFKKSICYYFKGKIYNQENDSVLKKLSFKGNIENFAEDARGNILIQEVRALHLLDTNGKSIEIDTINVRPISGCHAVSASMDGHFLVQEKDSIYSFRDGRFTSIVGIPFVNEMYISNFMKLSPKAVVWRTDNYTGAMRSLTDGSIRTFPFHYYHYRHVSYTIVEDTVVCSNESDGVTQYRFGSSEGRRFLPGVEVSRTFRDDDGNTWFTTMGKGLYRLNSGEFRNIALNLPSYNGCSASYIQKIGQYLVVGTNRNALFRFHLPGISNPSIQQLSMLERKRIVYIDSVKDGGIVYGFDFSLEKANRNKWSGIPGVNMKSAQMKNDSQLLIASSVGAFSVDVKAFKVIDTIWRERTTTLFYNRDTTYIGTLNGLFMITQGNRPRWLGKDIPFLRRRIAAIVESPGGVLWIASYDDAGIIGLKDGKVVRHINKSTGLTSDICRLLLLQNYNLWVGTDQGLNRINLHDPGQRIYKYTANDGLGSNVINTVYVDSPMVYVGTPAGLTYFDQNHVNISDRCRLYLLSIQNSGRERIADSTHIALPHTDKHIRLEFAAISYRSAGDITYRYRLLGLDSSWRTTRGTFLEYPTLPSGKYQLQLIAINKFGSESRPVYLELEVETPWWQTSWFYALIILFFLVLSWLVTSIRIRQIRRRQKEKEALNQRMMEMEHMALQSQMNPHFIFNCLNSIQQYIFDQDIFAANKYITGFSKLIRATLQNSTRSFIFLQEEISYLSGYLSLEKLRFKEKMDYSIDVEPALQSSGFIIPPMLIQPFVENSMRHGLRHKKEGKGFIRISFHRNGNRLSVVVEDNGIGRKGAAAFKTREHIEYQSKGMSLTADRVRMINARYHEPIKIDVVDLEDDFGRPAGTRVIMEFPLFHLISENETI